MSTVISSKPELFLLCSNVVTLIIFASSVGKKVQECENDPLRYEMKSVDDAGIFEDKFEPIVVKKLVKFFHNSFWI
jgi:hypothetical protein